MKFKIFVLSTLDKCLCFKAKITELNKYKDKRRKKIYSSVKLTSIQKQQINKLYKQHYGKKIPHTWHKHFTAFTGKFDKYYFPELLFIPEFERYMNYNKNLAKVLEDKNLLPYFANQAHIKTPKTIISCQRGLYKDQEGNIINQEQVLKQLENIGSCFLKPSIESDSGKGCRLLNFKNGLDKTSGETTHKIIKNAGNNFIIQEKVECHQSIKKIYDKSVNTFRIMTYRWKDEIIVAPAIMRIGQNNSFLDNAHAGGMFIAINEDGTLHQSAFTEFKEEYYMHPNSKLIYKDYKIELFPQVREATKKMHTMLSDIGVINWDMTLNENGEPILIEANVNGGSIWLFQMAHGCSVFGDKTPEILQWIKTVKKIKYKDRINYLYGKTK